MAEEMIGIRQVLSGIRGGESSSATLVELLRSCPSDSDIAMVAALPITIDERLLGNWLCSLGGKETSVELSIINQFRIMAAMRFDAPIPLLGTTTVLEWIQRLIARGDLKSISYVNGAGGVEGGQIAAGRADLSGKSILLDAKPFSGQWTRMAFDSRDGMSAIVPIGLIIHEARHLEGFVHECRLRSGNSDRSLAYGGAFAASYWWALWCADHSGDFLPVSVRDSLRSRAASMRDTVFCE